MEPYAAVIAITTSALSVAMTVCVPYFTGYDLIASFNGILMSFALGLLYVRHGMTFFNHLYGATFTIYLLSWFPQAASQQLLLALIQLPWYVTTVLAFLSGIYIPLAVYKWTMANRSKPAGRALARVIGL